MFCSKVVMKGNLAVFTIGLYICVVGKQTNTEMSTVFLRCDISLNIMIKLKVNSTITF